MAPPPLGSLTRDALDPAEAGLLRDSMPNRPIVINTCSPRRYFPLCCKIWLFRPIYTTAICYTPIFSHLVIAIIPTDSDAEENPGFLVVDRELWWLCTHFAPNLTISNHLRWTSSQLPTWSNGPTPAWEPYQRCPRPCWGQVVAVVVILACYIAVLSTKVGFLPICDFWQFQYVRHWEFVLKYFCWLIILIWVCTKCPTDRSDHVCRNHQYISRYYVLCKENFFQSGAGPTKKKFECRSGQVVQV